MIIIDENEFSQFISSSPNKAPKAIVMVSSFIPGHKDYMYEVPSGFQFDRYIASLFPYNSVMVQIGPNGSDGWRADVLDEKERVLESHVGLYIREESRN